MFLCNSPSSYSNTSEDSPSLVFSEFNLANSSSSPFTFASIAEIALGSVEGSAFFFSCCNETKISQECQPTVPPASLFGRCHDCWMCVVS